MRAIIRGEPAIVRRDLLDELGALNPQVPDKALADAVETILNSIIGAMAEGRRVELRGFGVFDARLRPPRAARNPRTGGAVAVPERRKAKFTPSPLLNRRLTESR